MRSHSHVRAVGLTHMSAIKKRKVGDAVVEALDAARTELERRETKVEEREEALRKALEGVEHEKQLMAGRTPNDVLALNIGGTKIHVLRKTLCQCDKSMLSAYFSGRWDDSVDKDADGHFFIDQPYDLMLPLINFLRAKAIEDCMPHLPAELTQATKESVDFKRVVEHYTMTPFVFPLRFNVWRGSADNATIDGGEEPRVTSTTWSTYNLSPVRHTRSVSSFEVVLGAGIERPQVGWFASCSSFGQKVVAGEHKGLGEEGSSIALDSLRGGVQMNGTTLKAVSSLSLQEGSVVTCENTDAHFRWLVDGTEVAIVLRSELPDDPLSADHHGRPIPGSQPLRSATSCVPAITSKGQWHVSQFAYSA